jgi:hypothetical protein
MSQETLFSLERRFELRALYVVITVLVGMAIFAMVYSDWSLLGILLAAIFVNGLIGQGLQKNRTKSLSQLAAGSAYESHDVTSEPSTADFHMIARSAVKFMLLLTITTTVVTYHFGMEWWVIIAAAIGGWALSIVLTFAAIWKSAPSRLAINIDPPEEETTTGGMPSNVAYFEILMYAALGIGVVNSVFQFQHFSSHAGGLFTFIVQTGVFGIVVLLTWLSARRRKNWARWTLLIGSLLSIPMTIRILDEMLSAHPLAASLSIGQIFMQGTALYLIFSGNAVAWFKRPVPGEADNNEATVLSAVGARADTHDARDQKTNSSSGLATVSLLPADYETDSTQDAFRDQAQRSDWEVAVGYYPDLDAIYADLKKISINLALEFRAKLLETKQFSSRKELARQLEENFLRTYFGGSAKIVGFAHTLVARGHKAAAMELNRAISVLGKGADENLIIERVRNKFDLGPVYVPAPRRLAHPNFLAVLLIPVAILAVFWVSVMTQPTSVPPSTPLDLKPSASRDTLVSPSTPVTANPFADADAAYQRGDYATALWLFRPLAEQGYPRAQYFVGVMYSNGRGVPQDYAEAVKWYRLAAEQGNPDAQNNFGFSYQNGHGVPQDYAEAVKWYRRAADQGDAFAQDNLGWSYFHGHGVPQDDTEAVKWYRLAADQGYASAQHNLGFCYLRGYGVPKDYITAHMWLSLSLARETDEKSRDDTSKLRDSTEKEMTPAQIAEAQRRAVQWTATPSTTTAAKRT